MEERARNVKNPERRWLVSSDPEEHVEQLAPYLELGFTHLVFHHPGDDLTHPADPEGQACITVAVSR